MKYTNLYEYLAQKWPAMLLTVSSLFPDLAVNNNTILALYHARKGR